MYPVKINELYKKYPRSLANKNYFPIVKKIDLLICN